MEKYINARFRKNTTIYNIENVRAFYFPFIVQGFCVLPDNFPIGAKLLIFKS